LSRGKLATEEARIVDAVVFKCRHMAQKEMQTRDFCWLQQALEWSLEQTEH